jgi:hypothetical protein
MLGTGGEDEAWERGSYDVVCLLGRVFGGDEIVDYLVDLFIHQLSSLTYLKPQTPKFRNPNPHNFSVSI